MAELNFNKMRFRVDQAPKGKDILAEFPELAKIESFRDYKEPDKDKVIKYIAYVYDPGSPFVQTKQDLKNRKEAAADEAGWIRKEATGRFTEAKIYSIMELMEPSVFPMIIGFLKLLNQRKWSLIVTNEEIFDEYTGLLMQPITEQDDKKKLEAANVKSKLREECKSIVADLDVHYKDFYGDNKDVEEKAKRLTPETIFKNKQ